MQPTQIRKNMVYLLSAALSLSAAPPVLASDTAPTHASASFEACLDELFLDIIRSSPVSLHYCYAQPPAEFQVTEQPLGYFTESNEETLQILQKASDSLACIQYQDLTDSEKKLYTRLQDYLKLQTDYCYLPDYFPTLAPMSGLLSSLDTMITEYYLLSEKDVLDYLALLADIPRFLQDIQLELTWQDTLGFSVSDYSLQNALAQKDVMLSVDAHPYLAAFQANCTEAGLSEQQQEQYTQAVRGLLTDEVIPAYAAFYESLEQRLTAAPHSQGLCAYPQGSDYYELLVRDKTGTDMTPEQLMTYLNQQIETQITAISNLYYQYPNAFEELDNFTAPENDPEEILQTMIQLTQEAFPAIEPTEYTLSYLPEALEIENNLAYYLSPPVDQIHRNVIRLNGSEIGEDPLQLWTTLAHEGFPGHLYQTQYSMQKLHTHPLESLLDCTGASEGWAYYTERLSLEWAGLDPALAELYFSDMIVGMAIMSVVDIGVNYEGWSNAEIAAYLEPYYGSVSDADCQDYMDICANDPAVFLPYSVGYFQTVEILDSIRPYYANEKQLYAAYLNQGMLPFRLLNRYLNLDGSI